MMDVFSASAAEPARLGFLTKQFALVSCHVAFVFFEGFPQVIGSDIFKGVFYFPRPTRSARAVVLWVSPLVLTDV